MSSSCAITVVALGEQYHDAFPVGFEAIARQGCGPAAYEILVVD